MQQVVIARTGQRIFQGPEPSLLWLRITGGRIPLDNRNRDEAGCVGLNHPPDLSQIGVHAGKVSAVIMMGRDEVKPGPGTLEYTRLGYDESS